VGVNSWPVPGHDLGALASRAGTDSGWGGQMWRAACPSAKGERRVRAGGRGAQIRTGFATARVFLRAPAFTEGRNFSGLI